MNWIFTATSYTKKNNTACRKKCPKDKNYFIYNDDPFSTDTDNIPAGFSWDMNNIIDWSFHCIAHYENGELKSIEVSRYDPVTGQVTIVDGPPNAVLNADTPPTGYPGVPIKLKEFYSYNYKFTPKLVDNKAFLQVTKKLPNGALILINLRYITESVIQICLKTLRIMMNSMNSLK